MSNQRVIHISEQDRYSEIVHEMDNLVGSTYPGIEPEVIQSIVAFHVQRWQCGDYCEVFEAIVVVNTASE